MKKIILLATLALGFVACQNDLDPIDPPTPEPETGYYVLNQGNMYNGIAGSLGYHDDQTGAYTADIFGAANSGISIGDTPQQVIAYGSKVYVAAFASNIVWVLDGKTNKVLKQITTPEPEALAGAEGKVFIANNDGKVSVIDTLDYALKAEIAVGPNPASLCAVGDKVYCAISDGYNYMNNYADGFRVALVDAKALVKIRDIHVGMNPTSLAATADGTVYCVCMGDYGTVLPCVYRLTETDSREYCPGSIIATHDNILYVVNSVTTYGENYDVVGYTVDYKAYDTKTDNVLPFDIAKDDRPVSPIAMRVRQDGMIFITSDGYQWDYNSPGYVYRYDREGHLLGRLSVGTHPYDLVFVEK